MTNLTRRTFLTNLLKSLAAVPALAVVPFVGKASNPNTLTLADIEEARKTLTANARSGPLRWPQTPISDELKDDAIIRYDVAAWKRLAIKRGDHIIPLFTNDTLKLSADGKAGYRIRPGDLLIKREDGLLYPFSGQHPFVGVATEEAGAGQCVEYIRARQWE